jgi:RecA/RadA recombinase
MTNNVPSLVTAVYQAQKFNSKLPTGCPSIDRMLGGGLPGQCLVGLAGDNILVCAAVR